MINGMTVEDYNAREKRRASIVARLHGYTPWEAGDTETGLMAQFFELTGKSYRSQEEEQAAKVEEAKEERQQRLEALMDSDRQIIADAKANGFMDCRAVRDALGWDKPNAKGNYRSSLSVALHWIEEADEEVVYLIPDGITDVTKSERTGCYPDTFARVLAVKEEWDADRAVREQKSWDDAQAAKNAFDKQKKDELAELIAQQEAARAVWSAEQAERYAQIDAARDAEIQLLIAEAEADDEMDEQDVFAAAADLIRNSVGRQADKTASNEEIILQAMRDYTGPMNKRGTYPKGPFMGLRGKAKRELWDRRLA